MSLLNEPTVIQPSKANAIDSIGAKNKAIPIPPNDLSNKPSNGVVDATSGLPVKSPAIPITISGSNLIIVAPDEK